MLMFLAPFVGPAPFALLERAYGVTPVFERMAVALGVGLLVLAAVWLFSTFLFNKYAWPKLWQNWHGRFFCLRCGEIFIADDYMRPA